MTQAGTIDLEAIRWCMLREPIGADVDAIVTEADPIKRCLWLARILSEAAQRDEATRIILDDRGVMRGLREEALARKSGDRGAAQSSALYALSAAAPAPREGA